MQGTDGQDGGGHHTGQEDSAVDVQRADLGSPPAWIRLERDGFEEHELDFVLISTNRRWHRPRLPPPQASATTDGNAEHEGEEECGVCSPPGGDLFEQLGADPREERRSRGADLQQLLRLLRCAIVEIAHMQTICTERGAGFPETDPVRHGFRADQPQSEAVPAELGAVRAELEAVRAELEAVRAEPGAVRAD